MLNTGLFLDTPLTPLRQVGGRARGVPFSTASQGDLAVGSQAVGGTCLPVPQVTGYGAGVSLFPSPAKISCLLVPSDQHGRGDAQARGLLLVFCS